MKKVVKALLITALGIGAIAPAYAAESAGQAGAYLKMGVGARASKNLFSAGDIKAVG